MWVVIRHEKSHDIGDTELRKIMLIVEDMNENTHNRTFQFNAIARKWPED